MGLLITLYLITSNVYGSVEAPDDRGFSFIEIWMVGVEITMLLAIFEYITILVMKRRLKLKNVGLTDIQGVDQGKTSEEMFKTIDELTTIGSAIFFLTFNVCYWGYCVQKV